MDSLEERNNNGQCANEVREGGQARGGCAPGVSRGWARKPSLTAKLEGLKPLNRLTLIGDDLSLP